MKAVLKKNTTRCAALLLGVCLVLGGCGNENAAVSGGPTLPPVPPVQDAPVNDVNQSYSQTVLLYLPAPDGSRLVAVPREASLSISAHSAQRLCEMLLASPGDDGTESLGGEVALNLSETLPVEVSGNAATVNLAASALRLSYERLFTVGQALANTLCQFGDLQYVNVLINGVQPGLDVAGTLPVGSFQPNTREALGALWSRASAPRSAARRAVAATLYYPAAGGKGILSEGRLLSFADLTPAGIIRTLLDALSADAETLPGIPRCPDLTALLAEEPAVTQVNGEKRAVLRFGSALNQAVIDAGITRSVMVAALACTVTTFLPGLDGVEIWFGNEQITELTPSGTYVGAGERIVFPNGLMKRSQFQPFLLADCTMYLRSGDALQPVSRPVPYYEARSVRAILDQLMAGPQAYDSVSGVRAPLPEGLRDADLLGVSFAGDTLTLNFSGQLATLSEGMSAADERLMIYAMVNTLCELPGVKKVRFLVMGEQPETLAGNLFLPGDFLPNLNLIH